MEEDFADPMELEKDTPGEKWCTNCALRKPLHEFHKDEQKPDGHRDTCKACRAEMNATRKKQKLDQRLAELEEENLATLDEVSKGGSYDPHINEMFEALMRPFGGVNGFAKQTWATYIACEPGSQKRVKMIEMMVRLSDRVTQHGLAEKQLDLMESRDLQRQLHKYQAEYQRLTGHAVEIEDDVIEIEINEDGEDTADN